jgi:hypothetical protein
MGRNGSGETSARGRPGVFPRQTCGLQLVGRGVGPRGARFTRRQRFCPLVQKQVTNRHQSIGFAAG